MIFNYVPAHHWTSFLSCFRNCIFDVTKKYLVLEHYYSNIIDHMFTSQFWFHCHYEIQSLWGLHIWTLWSVPRLATYGGCKSLLYFVESDTIVNTWITFLALEIILFEAWHFHQVFVILLNTIKLALFLLSMWLSLPSTGALYAVAFLRLVINIKYFQIYLTWWLVICASIYSTIHRQWVIAHKRLFDSIYWLWIFF